MSSTAPHRKVLMVLTAPRPRRRALDSACALCRRMGAGLEVVCLRGATPDHDLADAIREIRTSGLNCEQVDRPDWDVEDLVEWANNRACVATVVVPASEHQAIARASDHTDRWHRLDCPLVLAGREPDESNQSDMK